MFLEISAGAIIFPEVNHSLVTWPKPVSFSHKLLLHFTKVSKSNTFQFHIGLMLIMFMKESCHKHRNNAPNMPGQCLNYCEEHY